MAYKDKIYKIDWQKLMGWLVLKEIQQPKLMAFAKALIASIVSLYAKFIRFRNNTNYWLAITPQVCFMEKALNDRYDNELRRIVIEDATERLPFPLFLKVENKPVVFSTKTEGNAVVMYTKQETAQFTVDFIVKVSVFIDFDITEMTAFVKSIPSLATKTFKIMVV